jgi:hypothetical protein
MAMCLGQLTGRHSLRDIESNMSAQSKRLYHLGAKPIARSSLARLNEKQPAELYEVLFAKLYANCQKSNCQKLASGHRFRFKNKLFVGNSKNAILTQIWIALCTYLILTYLKFSAKLGWSLQSMLRLLQLNLFIRRDLMALLRGDPPEQSHMENCQLSLI